MNVSNIRPSRCAVAFSITALTLAAGASATGVLHDQRLPAIAGTWDTFGDAYIGGFTTGGFKDSQVADDFSLSSQSSITAVAFDFATTAPSGTSHPAFLAPAGGFLVELFADAGGKPSETPTFAVTTMSFVNLGAFAPSPVQNVPQTSLATIMIDLTANEVVLGSGTWWLSVVAVDETPFGLFYRAAGTRNPSQLLGASVHRRQGGADHGNGYSSGDWAANGGQAGRPREFSFRVEGKAIPAPPAGLTLGLGLCGTLARKRRRPVAG